jgi:hypothetical protein
MFLRRGCSTCSGKELYGGKKFRARNSVKSDSCFEVYRKTLGSRSV